MEKMIFLSKNKMRKILSIIFLASIFLSACVKKEQNFISKATSSLSKYTSISYQIEEKYYYSNAPDTTFTPYEVWLVRDQKSSKRNGYIWVNNNYRPYHLIYSAGDFFLVIPPKKTSILYPDYSEAFISDIDWIDIFLKPGKLNTMVSDTNISVSLSDTSYQQRNYTKMVVAFKNRQAKVTEKHTYIIDNKDFVPIWAKLESKKKDYLYTQELTFSNYRFNQTKLDELKARQEAVLLENPVEGEGGGSELVRMEKMLHIGDKAPLFSGEIYSSAQAFQLADYIGKSVIILDFWYTHCPPCVRAIPHLSELQKEYKDKGLIVFGLNSVDNQPHSLDNLDAFLAKRDLSYNVVLTSPSVDNMFKISGYPTMYIIDKQGKVSYIELGFDEESFEVLKHKVKELLE